MIDKIRKRNEDIISFDLNKITNAIYKAMESVGKGDYKIATKLSTNVEKTINKKFHKNSIPAVEEIQDIVEQELIKKGYSDIAKAYIIYRENHRKLRDTENLFINIQNTMGSYLDKSDWRVNENSNIDYSLGGLIMHNSNAIIANFWLENIYPSCIANAHRDGSLHIHDLGFYGPYCAGWSLRQLILEGFGGVENKINAKPPRHFNILIYQMVNFLGVLQNEWAGAQAFSSVDTYLAPFVWSDKLSYESVKRCIESLIYGFNVPSRWASQSPFINLTFDWVVPDDLKDQPAIIGGKLIDKTYGEFQKEMDMINKAFLEVMLQGDASGRCFSYPIPTYNITKNFNWDIENAELLFKMTGKYGTPYFQNFVNSDLDPSSVRSMCCRLSLRLDELRKRGGGLFGSGEQTGSAGVVTINMPRIGYIASNKEEYFSYLTHYMNIARDSLEIKRKVIARLLDQGLYPYTKRYLGNLNNHFNTIGLIGMNESLLNFTGKDITNAENCEFVKEVLNFMRSKLVEYQEETGNLYNLEATPGEGTSYRLAKIDKENFPDMIISGKEYPYYTNSTQLPVNCTDDIFEALDMQNDIQSMYTGGTVFHAFIGEAISGAETVKNLVKKIAYNYTIPYFTLSPTFSICATHGYLKGEQERCPVCNNETEVYSRIVGYYRPVKNWNHGKKSEYRDRVTFKAE